MVALFQGLAAGRVHVQVLDWLSTAWHGIDRFSDAFGDTPPEDFA